MIRYIKIGIIAVLLCIVGVEAAILVPRVLTRPTEDSLLPESTEPVNTSQLDLDSTDGLPGVTLALEPAQLSWQRSSTKDVADFIKETGATEEARIKQAQAKAEAKLEFLKEQRRLSQELARIRREEAEKKAGSSLNDPNVPGYVSDPGVYIVGDGGTLDNPSSLTKVNPDGTTSEVDTSIYGDGEYHYVPSTPGSSLSGDGSSEYVFNPTTVSPGGLPSQEPSKPASEGETSYCGEFNATFVCTCSGCFNPSLWPESRLMSSFVSAPTAYLTPGIPVRVEGGIGGAYFTEDGDSYLSGRDIVIYHYEHDSAAGALQAVVKVYRNNE